MAESSDRIRFDDTVERTGTLKSRSRPSQQPVSIDEKEVDSVFDDAVPAAEDRDFKRKQV